MRLAETPQAAPMTLRVIIAGGYTGGHISCALALAAALRQAVPGVELLLAGAHGGPEVGAARAAGLPIETVWIGGLSREVSPRGLAHNLLIPLQLLVSRRQAGRIVDRFRPDVVAGVGGYASAPLVAEAQRRGLPTVIHEANSLPGITNRFLARRASVICVGTEDAAGRFEGRATRVTGNPVRPDLVALTRVEGRRRLGLGTPATDRRTLLVLGGSLGSPLLNRWVLAEQQRFAGARLEVIWQSGRAHHATCRARMQAPLALYPYLDDMAAAYAAADLIVTSAGASTVSELGELGKAAILVPSPEVAEDHQRHNVRFLGQRGLEVCLDTGGLFARAARLAHDHPALEALRQSARQLAAPGAAARIAAEVIGAAGGDR